MSDKLTPEQRKIMDGLIADLSTYVERNAIGTQSSDRILGEIEGAAKMRHEDAGMQDADAVAGWVWSCPERTAVEEELWDFYPDGEADCPYYIVEPTWREAFWTKLRLKLTGSPGCCPDHGTPLEHIVQVTCTGVFPYPVQRVFSRVTVNNP